jgi:hypothetical protein
MELAGTIGNRGPNISSARIRLCIFSAWGVTGKIFGLLLAYNQVLLVLVGRRWSCWGIQFTDEA